MYAYHVILLTKDRWPIFLEHHWPAEFEKDLKEASATTAFVLLAYCFMPDHLHMLIQGKSDDSSLLKFIQRFKQMTAFSYKHAEGTQLWQQSFYDRTLRKNDDVRVVAEYIFENPVKAGLSTAPNEYAFSGGELFSACYADSDGAKATSLRSARAETSHD